MRAKLKQSLILCLLYFLVAGCIATPPKATIDLYKLQSNPGKIKDIFIVINTSSFPEEFLDPFVTTLETLLTEEKVNVGVRKTSPLDLEPVRQEDYLDYTNIMTIQVSHKSLVNFRLERFTMRIHLVDINQNIDLMDGTIVVDRGFKDVGFLQPGAENAAKELILNIQKIDLL